MNNFNFSKEITLPTIYGTFKCFAVKDNNLSQEHFVIYKGETKNQECLLRIHSKCLTGDLFGSLKCDCGPQLADTLKLINEKNGILIYLAQEGRNIGLFNKIEAYKLQEEGMDTVEANISLGLPIDGRDYAVAGEILKKLAPKKINLLSNNPDKIESITNLSFLNCERVPTIMSINKFNQNYMQTKIDKLSHNINMN